MHPDPGPVLFWTWLLPGAGSLKEFPWYELRLPFSSVSLRFWRLWKSCLQLVSEEMTQWSPFSLPLKL